MANDSMQDLAALALGLLDFVPRLQRRVHSDVLVAREPQQDALWQDFSEIQATPGQLSLLRILVKCKRCSMQELAEYAVVAPSTATAMVKRLLAQGYVERSRGVEDWRTVWVQPTARGEQVIALYDHVRLAALQRRLQQLNDDERERIVAALPALQRLTEVEV